MLQRVLRGKELPVTVSEGEEELGEVVEGSLGDEGDGDCAPESTWLVAHC